jgi:ABC-type multidrug transport system fused ATPase/permease subunit
MNRLRPKDRRAYEENGLFSEKRYYFGTMSSLADQGILDKYGGIVVHGGDFFFISYDHMAKMDPRDLAHIRRRDIAGVARMAMVFVAVLIFGFALNFFQVYAMEYAGQRVMHDLRMKLFNHVQGLSVAFFEKNPVGRLVTRVTNDIQNIHEMLTSVLSYLFKDVFLMVGIVVILFEIHWRLALVCFTLVPVILLFTLLFSWKARTAFREVRIRMAQINSFLQESIQGIRVIQIFLRERENLTRFERVNQQHYMANMKQILLFAIFVPLIEVTATCAIALLIWYGGGKVVKEALSLGALVAFLSYLRMFFQPIRDLAEKYNLMQSAMASAERIILLMDNPERIPDPISPIRVTHLEGRIEFKNVSFAYRNADYVLKNISFTVQPGETVAIVGATGAGKTSIISLIERFYEIQQGQILLDGVDICQMEAGFLRSCIGLVMQDVFLFASSVDQNIRLGNDSLSEEDVRWAAGIVNADRFIHRLPMGYRQEINEGGSVLSAGERQLLAFARALILNPKILVLDEATSNVDTETERLIQGALERLMKERTCIVIAHRLSTIRRAHRILVMHRGRIREEGSHQELMRKKGYYWRLYRLQYGGNNVDEDPLQGVEPQGLRGNGISP